MGKEEAFELTRRIIDSVYKEYGDPIKIREFLHRNRSTKNVNIIGYISYIKIYSYCAVLIIILISALLMILFIPFTIQFIFLLVVLLMQMLKFHG